jgi:NADPH-dependent 2,4-dienoyl-CoA reductase/sulfur reductase-like enzyme
LRAGDLSNQRSGPMKIPLSPLFQRGNWLSVLRFATHRSRGSVTTMAIPKTIIVVGSTESTHVVAAQARQVNELARIIVIEEALRFLPPKESPMNWLTGDDEALLKALRIEDDLLYQRYNIEIRRSTRAVELDVDSQSLIVTRQGIIERIHYDALVYASQAIPHKLDVPGLSDINMAGFYTLDDCRVIKKAISDGARHAIVVGCGFQGIKAAMCLKACGLLVTIIDHKKRIMPKFSLPLAQAMVEKLAQQGITVMLGETITSVVKAFDNDFDVLMASGKKACCDLLVSCIGLTPKTSLLLDAGAALDIDDLIRVDDHLLTTLPNVYACGMGVSVALAVSGEQTWMPHAPVMERLAHVAAHNASVPDRSVMEAIKPFCQTIVVDIGDMTFARTGLSEHEARKAVGDDHALVVTTFATSPDACIKLVLNRKNGSIIGGEVFSSQGVLRIIDLLALAVHHGFSVAKLIDVDMAQSALVDSLKQAALRAHQALRENLAIMSAEVLALWLASNRDFRMVLVDQAPPVLGGIAGKVEHVPLEYLRERALEFLTEDSPIVLCSRSGNSSYLAQAALVQRGVKGVYQLDGGFRNLNLITAKEHYHE